MNSLNAASLDHSALITSMGTILFGYALFVAAMASQVLQF